MKKKKAVTIWGTGQAKREMLFVDDLADAIIFFIKKKTKETLINIGSGKEMKIIDYANFVIKELNLDIKIKTDLSKPNGTPRKIINSSIAKKYGWKPKINLKKGFNLTYLDFLKKI